MLVLRGNGVGLLYKGSRGDHLSQIIIGGVF